MHGEATGKVVTKPESETVARAEMIAPPRPFSSEVQNEVETPRPGVPAEAWDASSTGGAVRGEGRQVTDSFKMSPVARVKRLSVKAVRASVPAVRPGALGVRSSR
jgi:hypothetical protein